MNHWQHSQERVQNRSVSVNAVNSVGTGSLRPTRMRAVKRPPRIRAVSLPSAFDSVTLPIESSSPHTHFHHPASLPHTYTLVRQMTEAETEARQAGAGGSSSSSTSQRLGIQEESVWDEANSERERESYQNRVQTSPCAANLDDLSRGDIHAYSAMDTSSDMSSTDTDAGTTIDTADIGEMIETDGRSHPQELEQEEAAAADLHSPQRTEKKNNNKDTSAIVTPGKIGPRRARLARFGLLPQEGEALDTLPADERLVTLPLVAGQGLGLDLEIVDSRVTVRGFQLPPSAAVVAGAAEYQKQQIRQMELLEQQHEGRADRKGGWARGNSAGAASQGASGGLDLLAGKGVNTAEQSGEILPGDMIVGIDGQDLTVLEFEDVVLRLKSLASSDEPIVILRIRIPSTNLAPGLGTLGEGNGAVAGPWRDGWEGDGQGASTPHWQSSYGRVAHTLQARQTQMAPSGAGSWRGGDLYDLDPDQLPLPPSFGLSLAKDPNLQVSASSHLSGPEIASPSRCLGSAAGLKIPVASKSGIKSQRPLNRGLLSSDGPFGFLTKRIKSPNEHLIFTINGFTYGEQDLVSYFLPRQFLFICPI